MVSSSFLFSVLRSNAQVCDVLYSDVLLRYYNYFLNIVLDYFETWIKNRPPLPLAPLPNSAKDSHSPFTPQKDSLPEVRQGSQPGLERKGEETMGTKDSHSFRFPQNSKNRRTSGLQSSYERGISLFKRVSFSLPCFPEQQIPSHFEVAGDLASFGGEFIV